MVVLVGAAALGSRLGAASQILYLLLGVAGMPVFAASPILPQGAGRLLGPTGGYLMAYPIAAFVTGWLAERGFDRRYFTSVARDVRGTVHAVSRRRAVAGLVRHRTGGPWAGPALATGLYPFVVADLVKVCIASAILPAPGPLLGRSRYEALTR